MKSFVWSADGFIVPSFCAADSSVLTAVVPTAITRRFCARALLMIWAFFSSIEYHSECIWWSSRFWAVTGLKVPAPTWRVTCANEMPFAARESRRFVVKWRPAVGAATAPCSWAKTVW